jgi:hypothetical protein
MADAVLDGSVDPIAAVYSANVLVLLERQMG